MAAGVAQLLVPILLVPCRIDTLHVLGNSGVEFRGIENLHVGYPPGVSHGRYVALGSF
jgi:hypothetical protein